MDLGDGAGQCGAWISFCIFMASTTRTAWPSSIRSPTATRHSTSTPASGAVMLPRGGGGSAERASASLAAARGGDMEGAIAHGYSEVTAVSCDVGTGWTAIDHHGDEAGDSGESGVRDDGVVVVDGDAGLAVLFIDDEGACFAV